MARHTRTLVMLIAVVLASIGGAGVVVGGVVAADVETGAHTSETVGSATQADCSYPVTTTDVTGTEITVEDLPERIVVLQPSDAQIVWGVNGSDRVVGMPQGPTTAYLNDTSGITDVKNDDGTVDVEQVTNLSADVILAANVTRTGTVDQLRGTGTPVYHFGEVSSMTETYRNINATGELIGNCGPAADTVASMQTRLDRIQQAVADEERPRAMYLFYGLAAGEDTHVHSMLEIAGAENIADNETGYYEISEEVVTNEVPQWIVQPSGAPAPSGAAYNGTTAVQQDQVLTVSDNYANQAGPRVVRVVETMAQAFHPDAFDENGEPIVETPTPTATATAGDDSSTDTSTMTDGTTVAATDADPTGPTETTEGSGPGFTVATVAIALVAGALLVARRRKGV